VDEAATELIVGEAELLLSTIGGSGDAMPQYLKNETVSCLPARPNPPPIEL
jgi:hypothetical protein